MSVDILIVEDEDDIRELIGGILEDEGYQTRKAQTSEEALSLFRSRKPQLLVLDVWLKGSGYDGIELMEIFKKTDPDIPVIIISGHGTVETAVSAIRKGAYDYIVKPFESEKLLVTVKRALETVELRRENAQLKERSPSDNTLVGSSSLICQLRQKLNKIAATNSRILISGPSGAGKELIARVIHEKSPRHGATFQIVNAAAMTPNRVEEELFGVDNASNESYTVGLLERAHYGTLYIDEVADMPMETQGKLLRLLVDQRFRRIGGNEDVQVDVRIISSTSRDLEKLTRTGNFREDLFHRLNVMPLNVPPLVERREDIPELVNYFIGTLSTSTGLPAREIGEDAMAALQTHDWPGNVRQLRNNVERLLILASGDPNEPITLDSLPPEVSIIRNSDTSANQDKMVSLPLRKARENFERKYLKTQIVRFGGNISKTAAFVGMERSALHRKLKSLGISSSDSLQTANEEIG